MSKPILESNSIKQTILVTSEFHMQRAKLVFNRVLPDMEFEYAQACTVVSDIELKRLIQHETVAIKRDLSKL